MDLKNYSFPAFSKNADITKNIIEPDLKKANKQKKLVSPVKPLMPHLSFQQPLFIPYYILHMCVCLCVCEYLIQDEMTYFYKYIFNLYLIRKYLVIKKMVS